MTDNKVKTTLEIGVDDKALKQLAKSLEQSLSAGAMDAFTKSIERSTKEMTKLVDQTTKLIRLQEENSRKQRTRDDQERDRKRRGRVGETAVGTFLGNAMSGAARVPGAAVSYAAQNAPVREGFLSGMLSGIPYIGPVFGGAASAAQGYYADYVAQQRARASAFGVTGVGRPSQALRRAGQRYGLGPTELPASMQEFASASGVTGGAALEDRLPFAMRLQHMAGVGMGASGSMMEASSMLGGRNAMREQQRTEEMLATGLEMGIREARLGEFLQQMAGALNNMHSQGVMIAPESLAGMARGLSGVGRSFRGAAGTQAALGLTQMTQRLGERESMLDMLAVQDAGYGQGGQGYWQSLMRLEENPNEILSSILRRVRGWGGDSEADRGARAATIYNSFRQAGGSLSRRQAYELAGMSQEQLAAFSGPTGADGLATFLEERDEAGQGVHAAPEAEARYQYQRAGLGGRISGDVQRMRRTEMTIVSDLLPHVTEFMGDFADTVLRLYRAFQAGGIGALVGEAVGSRQMGDGIVSGFMSVMPGTEESRATAEEMLRAQQAGAAAIAGGGTGTDMMHAATGGNAAIEAMLRNQIVATILNSHIGTYIASAILDSLGAAIRAYIAGYDWMRGSSGSRVLPADASVGQ